MKGLRLVALVALLGAALGSGLTAWVLGRRHGWSELKARRKEAIVEVVKETPAIDPSQDLLLVSGQISVHPLLHSQVAAGGSLHVRLMELGLLRPVMFKRFEKVQFPFHYEFRTTDYVGSGGPLRLAHNNFYVEVFYAPPGQELYVDRGHQFAGEAWGTIGKPMPLSVGAEANVTLAGIWTPEVYSGRLESEKEALMEGWLFTSSSLAAQIRPKNRVTFAVVKEPKVRGVQDKPPTVLAARRWIDWDATRPLAFHLGPAHILPRPIEPEWRGYFLTCVESFGPDGKREAVFTGGRASPGTVIGIYIKGFRVALNERLPPEQNPCAELGIKDNLPEVAPTYR